MQPQKTFAQSQATTGNPNKGNQLENTTRKFGVLTCIANLIGLLIKYHAYLLFRQCEHSNTHAVVVHLMYGVSKFDIQPATYSRCQKYSYTL